MATTSITVEELPGLGRRVCARADFSMKDALKAVPGARWHPELRCWHYPADPAAAEQLAEIFPGAGSPEFKALVPADSEEAMPDEPGDHEQLQAYVLPPRRYQVVASNRIMRKPGQLLEHRMGAGKTKAVIDACVNMGARLVLVAAPPSVCDVWVGEARKHAPGHFIVANTYNERWPVAKRAAHLVERAGVAAAHGKPLLAICNQESAWRPPMSSEILGRQWDVMCVDESHRIGDARTKVGSFFGRHARKVAAHRVCASATPLRNGPLDAFGQFMFLDPEVFGGSYTRFRATYAVMGGFGGKIVVGYRNQRDFRRRFYSIAHRVEESEIGGLPQTMHTARYVQLPPEAARVYNDLESRFIADVGNGEVVASNALAKLLRLQQITSGFMAVDHDDGRQELRELHDAKQSELRAILGDIPGAEPVVVFARFTRDLDAIAAAAGAAGRPCFELSGRRKELDEWKGGGDALIGAARREGLGGGDVLAVQIQAGGVGVDMTRACHCVYYSLGYSLTDYTQSLGRTHRPGQRRPVSFIHVLTRDTVDEAVYAALEAKTDVIDAILARTRQRITPGAQPPDSGEQIVDKVPELATPAPGAVASGVPGGPV